METIRAEVVKARVDELQIDINRVKSDLESLRESAKGNAEADTMQKLDGYTRELLTYKASQAELINLLQ